MSIDVTYDDIHIIILIAVVVLLILLCRWLTPKGRRGEKHVASILHRLPRSKYKVINNLLLNYRGRTSEIDHVVISPYAIFVIETKSYTGLIYGSERSEFWIKNVYGHKYSLLNPIHQNRGHIKAIRHCLQDRYNLPPIIPIVVFPTSTKLSITTKEYVIHWNFLRRLIRGYRTPAISDSEVWTIYRHLLSANTYSWKNKRKHIRNAKFNKRRRDNAVKSGHCPWCGGSLVLREGQYGKFYGCSNYPRCSYTHLYRE